MQSRRTFSMLILATADVITFYLALAISLVIRLGEISNTIWYNHLTPFSLLLVIWLIINYGMNEYDASLGNRTTFNQYAQSLKLFFLNLFSGITLFYLISATSSIAPKTILVIVTIIFSLLHFWIQTFFRKAFNKTNIASTNVVIIGDHPLVPNIISAIKNPLWGMNVIGWFKDEADNSNTVKIFPLSDLVNFSNNIDTMIVANSQTEKVTQILYKSLNAPRRIIKLMDVYEQIYQNIPVNFISINWVVDSLAKGKRNGYLFFKRTADIILAIILLIITLPLLPLIILAVKLSSHGPIFFKQIRSGYLGKEFLAIKFRTWYVGHETESLHLAQTNDPRVTKVGKLLRAIRFDEIPQLINILRGEMSFVGPRPERPELVKKYIEEQPLYAQRLLSKPGLTGWAQINQSYQQSADINNKLSFDLYYLKYQSLALDIKIILKTINTILSSNG